MPTIGGDFPSYYVKQEVDGNSIKFKLAGANEKEKTIWQKWREGKKVTYKFFDDKIDAMQHIYEQFELNKNKNITCTGLLQISDHTGRNRGVNIMNTKIQIEKEEQELYGD